MKIRPFIFLSLLLFYASAWAQDFEAIPKKDQSRYAFNLQDNFFKSEREIQLSIQSLEDQKQQISALVSQENLNPSDWRSLLQKHDALEREYRILDLYYFLLFAVKASDYSPLETADSIRNLILPVRDQLSQKINVLPQNEFTELLKNLPVYHYYLTKKRQDGRTQFTGAEKKLLQPFAYLENNRFYDEGLKNMTFEKVETKDGPIDVIEQPGLWENHPDEAIRDKAEATLLAGYETQRDFLAYNYINYIKGLNAFALAAGYSDIIEDKFSKIELNKKTVNHYFEQIAAFRRKPQEETFATDQFRFDIKSSTDILVPALAVIGKDYAQEVRELLNPTNGRIDIVGGPDRLPIRGTASVFPIPQSVFYAQNYEGYLLDLTLLAHEIGHAVQASLMYQHQVPMFYASGPAYFTESFGKFNELLLFDFLAKNEIDPAKKQIFEAQLSERMKVIYGSTLEAAVEYHLIEGILKGDINSPDDLDKKTYEIGLVFDPSRFKDRAYLKSFWMLLETNFRAPLHNVNDMFASVLAVQYFKWYKADHQAFLTRYNLLLKNGYHQAPNDLLRPLGIDLKDENLLKESLKFIEEYDN